MYGATYTCTTRSSGVSAAGACSYTNKGWLLDSGLYVRVSLPQSMQQPARTDLPNKGSIFNTSPLNE